MPFLFVGDSAVKTGLAATMDKRKLTALKPPAAVSFQLQTPVVSAQYVRVQLTDMEDYLQVTEVEVFDSGGTNFASGKGASC